MLTTRKVGIVVMIAFVVCGVISGVIAWRNVEKATEAKRLAQFKAMDDERRERQAVLDREWERQARAAMRDCAHCPELVVIPAGSFWMGAIDGEEEKAGVTPMKDARPRQRLTIGREFLMGRFPVMVSEYRVFARAEPANAGDAWRSSTLASDDTYPVVNVSWNQAKAYVAWLSRTTGKTYRLPSEAEWEYAARGGRDGQIRYWGDEWDREGRHAPRSSQMDAPSLKSFAITGENPFRLVAMLGHVYQWTEDCWNDDLTGQPVDGAARSQTGECSERVMRGGAPGQVCCRHGAATRARAETTFQNSDRGLRVVRLP